MPMPLYLSSQYDWRSSLPHLGVEPPAWLTQFALEDTLVGPVNVGLALLTPVPGHGPVETGDGGADVVLVVDHQLAVLLHADLVVDLVDVLVDAAPLPEDVRPTDLTGVFLLVDHGPAVLGRVVLHGHVVPLLDVVRHLAVGVEHSRGLTLPVLRVEHSRSEK